MELFHPVFSLFPWNIACIPQIHYFPTSGLAVLPNNAEEDDDAEGGASDAIFNIAEHAGRSEAANDDDDSNAGGERSAAQGPRGGRGGGGTPSGERGARDPR